MRSAGNARARSACMEWAVTATIGVIANVRSSEVSTHFRATSRSYDRIWSFGEYRYRVVFTEMVSTKIVDPYDAGAPDQSVLPRWLRPQQAYRSRPEGQLRDPATPRRWAAKRFS